MKSTIKVVLVLALFCGSVLADDGDMGNGGLWGGTTTKEEIIVVNNTGDMGNGGKTCPNGQTTCFAAPADNSLSVFGYIRGFLASIF